MACTIERPPPCRLQTKKGVGTGKKLSTLIFLQKIIRSERCNQWEQFLEFTQNQIQQIFASATEQLKIDFYDEQCRRKYNLLNHAYIFSYSIQSCFVKKKESARQSKFRHMTLLKIGRLAAATTLVQKRFASNASEEKAQLAKLDYSRGPLIL